MDHTIKGHDLLSAPSSCLINLASTCSHKEVSASVCAPATSRFSGARLLPEGWADNTAKRTQTVSWIPSPGTEGGGKGLLQNCMHWAQHEHITTGGNNSLAGCHCLSQMSSILLPSCWSARQAQRGSQNNTSLSHTVPVVQITPRTTLLQNYCNLLIAKEVQQQLITLYTPSI